MDSCIYPGSFDPVTKGHKDLIARACNIFDKVYVALLVNSAKKYMFNIDERVSMIKAVCSGFKNARVLVADGLLADVMKENNIKTIIRGLRSTADLEYERQLATVNYDLAQAETIMLLSKPEMQHVSSSIVRELISYKANVDGYVPEEILDIISRRYAV